jgi:hypothetical protein
MRVKLKTTPPEISRKEMAHHVVEIIFFVIGFTVAMCEMVRRSRHGSKTES